MNPPETIDSSNTLEEFFAELLEKPQERLYLLRLEKILEEFITNERQNRFDFPPKMNPYQRLIVHKTADYFNLLHYYNREKESLFLCKKAGTEMPKMRFTDLIERKGQSKEEKPNFTIMKRSIPQDQNDAGSKDEVDSTEKSQRPALEERKVAYEEARARIFQDSWRRVTDAD